MNSEQKKFLDENGLKILWNQISMHDYPNNAALTSVINAIDANKADKADIPRIDTTLSAAGAAADAKAVGEAIENIELTPGPKGDSGVYVGASAPTDESVNVWINPNGEAADSPTGGSSYILPITTQNTLGGVKPVTKSDDMTQSVGVDADGGLWTFAGSHKPETIKSVVVNEDVSSFVIDVADVVNEIMEASIVIIKFVGVPPANTDVPDATTGNFEWITGGVTRSWLAAANFMPRGNQNSYATFVIQRFDILELKHYVIADRYNTQRKYNQDFTFGYLEGYPTQQFKISSDINAIGAGSTFEIDIVR